MCSNVNNEILDGILTVAFNEYLDREFADLPSDEELKKMFPISQKSLRKSKRRMKEIRYRKPLPLVYLQRAGVVFLTAATLCFGVFITRQEVRAAMMNTFIKQFDKYTKFEFGAPETVGEEILSEKEIKEEENKVLDVIADLKIGYIPEGFELESSQSLESSGRRRYIYYNEIGEYLSIGISLPEDTCVSVDNENSELEATSINGNEAYINYNYEDKIGTVIVSNSDYVIHINCRIDRDELIKIAENIK